MQTAFQNIIRGLFAVYLVGVHVILLYFVIERVLQTYSPDSPISPSAIAQPSTDTSPIPTPLSVPDEFADSNASGTPNAQVSIAPSTSTGLLIPVAGVTPQQLVDTFSESRSENRFHDAIDIAAPAGTPVVAAADGEIARFFDSEMGGITIYQITADRKFVLYYAHLQRRAEEVAVGSRVKRGATIGYVGDTGNAGQGNFHLHFSIARITDPNRIWNGVYINPYDLLKNGKYPE